MRKRQWAEHAAMRSASVEGQGGGCTAVHQHSLRSARQEVKYPITQGGAESQICELDDEFGRHNGTEC